jgi:hypothetical protein
VCHENRCVLFAVWALVVDYNYEEMTKGPTANDVTMQFLGEVHTIKIANFSFDPKISLIINYSYTTSDGAGKSRDKV